MGGIGEAFLKKNIEKLVDVGFAYLEDQYGWHTGMKAELQRLRDALPRIQAVVNAAEIGPHQIEDPNLRAWLWQFKDAAYEADDVLDELDYLRLQKQVEEANDKDDKKRHDLKVRASNSLSRSKNKAVQFCKRVCKSDPTLEKLRAVVKKIDGIALHVGDFLSIVSTVQQQHQLHQAQIIEHRETGPLLPAGSSVVFGRDRERDELLQWLMKPADEDNVALFSVVGHGGMGKTTLSQLVFNNKSVQKFFDLKIWVCVSTSFDVRRLLAAVIESATKEKPKVESVAALQSALKEKLVSSGKFLLVLDDAWNDDSMSSWNNLLAPLKWGEKGSKILLTTRSDKVAEIAAQVAAVGKKEAMRLERLKDDIFIPLLYRYAFAGVKSDNYGKLQSIGKQIARRLGGSPLAAKSIGALLNSNLNDQHWTNILNNNILDAQQAGQDNIKSILMLSFNHLPAHLRSCFAYCSIFPQDSKIRKKTLIRMWVAVELIQQSRPQNKWETVEDIGGYYFDDLVKRSFLEPCFDDHCIMHDLLHELAQSVSQDECHRIVDDASIQAIPTMVRHLWVEIDNPNLLVKVDKWKNLRTLVLISREYNHHEHAMIFSQVFKSLKSIRILHLVVKGMVELPEKIGCLRHLRVLSTYPPLEQFISFSPIIKLLPSLICQLHHLQILELTWSLSNLVIPQGMKNLISLKRLTPPHKFEKINGVGKLTNLEELMFCVEEKGGHRIEELKDLRNLRELKIKVLENVKSHKEAIMAELHNKEQLLKLELKWGSCCSPDEVVEHEKIVDCLRPHSNLRDLDITGYIGGRAAKWLDYKFLNNLENISLSDLSRLECLPCLGKLPYLKYLLLHEIPIVKQIDCSGGFPQLEKLNIWSLDELEEWSGLVENLDQWCPRLQVLQVCNCPRLKILPSLPLRLTDLQLDNVGLTTIPSFWGGESCSSYSSTSSSSPSLCSVEIRDCEQLTSLATGLLQHDPVALEHLEISNCKELVDLPAEGFQHLSSLKTLYIMECPKLQLPLMIIPAEDCFRRLSPRYVYIGSCGDPEQIVANIVAGSASLRKLVIEKCEELTSLDSLIALHHLHHLTVYKCPKLVQTSASPSIKGESFSLTIVELVVDDPLLLLTKPLRNLTTVRNLTIKDCSRLDSLAGEMESWLLQNSASLEEVVLHNAVSLQSLPPSIQALTSLNHLQLYRLDKLSSLPRLPLFLKRLTIGGCNDTLKERCREDEGADWPKIKHILHICME